MNGKCQGMCGKVVVRAPAVSVEVNTGTASGVGTVLVGRTGLTLYELERKRVDRSCARTMPERVAAAPTASGCGSATPGPGVTGTLARIMRPDGGRQVTYDGRPLYLYSGDQSPGQANGQGIQGVWFAMTPSGPSGTPSPFHPAPISDDLTTACRLHAQGRRASDARDGVIRPFAEGHTPELKPRFDPPSFERLFEADQGDDGSDGEAEREEHEEDRASTHRQHPKHPKHIGTLSPSHPTPPPGRPSAQASPLTPGQPWTVLDVCSSGGPTNIPIDQEAQDEPHAGGNANTEHRGVRSR